MFRSHRVDDSAAADRFSGRVTAKHKPIVVQSDDRSFESELGHSATARRNLRDRIEHRYASQHFSRADVKSHSRTRSHGPRRARQHIEPNVDDLRRAQTSNGRELHAAFDLRGINARKINGSALTSVRPLHRLTVNLQTANTDLRSRREKFEFITFIDLTRDERTGNDSAKTFHRKRAIDWQTCGEVGRTRRNKFGNLREMKLEIIEALASLGAHGNHGRVFQKRSGN